MLIWNTEWDVASFFPTLQGPRTHRRPRTGGPRADLRRLPCLWVFNICWRTAAQQMHRNTQRHGLEVQHRYSGPTHSVSGEQKWLRSISCVCKKNVTSSRLFLQAMRSHENNEAQVCYFIIQLLLLKPNDFRNRVNDFVKENAPEHWLQSDWHNKHMNYHKVRVDHHTLSFIYKKYHLKLSSKNMKNSRGDNVSFIRNTQRSCTLRA